MNISACTICKYYELCVARGRDTKGICSEFKSGKAVRKRPTYEESSLQQECKRLFDKHYPNLSLLFFAVPNGADVSDRQRKKLTAEGMTAGVADTILLVPSKEYNCLCIEFKARKFKVLKSGRLSEEHGSQSKEQKAWEEAITKAGGCYRLIWTKEDFKKVIVDYLGYDNFNIIESWQKQ